MAPPGPSATEYHSPVSRGPHLSVQVTAEAARCQDDSAYSLTLKTRADKTVYNVCTAKLYCKLLFQILSINNYGKQPNGNIYLGFILLKWVSVEENVLLSDAGQHLVHQIIDMHAYSAQCQLIGIKIFSQSNIMCL